MEKSNQHTKDEAKTERITQILADHLKACLKFYDPKRESLHNFVDHILDVLSDVVIKAAKASDDVMSSCYMRSQEKTENECINFRLNCALLSLDRLFHTTTADLLKLSVADLEHKRKNALLLAKCLESVINLKKHREAQ